jgi:hypothetical protein
MVKLILTILSVLAVGAASVSAVVARDVQQSDPLRAWHVQEIQTRTEAQIQELTRSEQTGTGLMLQEQVMNQVQSQQMNQNGIGNQPQGQLQAGTADVPTRDQDRTRLQLNTADKLQDQTRLQDRDRIQQSKP